MTQITQNVEAISFSLCVLLCLLWFLKHQRTRGVPDLRELT